MPTYYDGYDGYDSYEHSIYVKLINAGFDTDDANLMAIVQSGGGMLHQHARAAH